MSKSNGYGEIEIVETTSEQRAIYELRQLVERGELAEALALAKKMRGEQEAAQVAESKSQALELIEQPGELDFDGLIGALEIAKETGNKYEGLFKTISNIDPKLPPPILGAKGTGGAVLTEGNVCVLSGQGGVAKSTLTASIALSFATCSKMEHGGMVALKDGIFEGTGGRVMIASFEDSGGTISYRINGLAQIWHEGGQDRRIWRALQKNILCANLPEPLFVGEGFDLPRPTMAWECLWEAAKEYKPKLIVIDPIIGAYLSNGNNPPEVFDFVKALAREAGKFGAGVLLVGHSNKAARQSANYDPFDAGHVAGTGAWTDAARGVMVLTRDRRKDNEGKTVLAIPKANFGPSYIETHVRPIYRDDVSDRMPYGMETGGSGWGGDNDNTDAEDSNNGKPGGKINTHGITKRS